MVLLRVLFFVLIFFGCSKNPQSIIKENYYSPNSKALDKYTKVLKGEEAKEFKKNIEGSYKGLGLVLIKAFGKIYVFDIVKNSPSDLHDIQKGDVLISINDKDIKKLSLTQVYKEIKSYRRGVYLTFRKKDRSIYRVFLKAEKIDTKSVEYRFISKNEVYIKINTFSKGVASKVEKILKNNHEIKFITFDLKDNGGGVFKEALELADLFVDNGVLLFEKGKNIDKTYYATNKIIGSNFDIKIVINHNTASASEIFTGIMRDYKKAVVVGEKSYGKGTIQKTYRLDNENILKVTVSEYFLPSGKSINGIGIIPDMK